MTRSPYVVEAAATDAIAGDRRYRERRAGSVTSLGP
jgi:hypothetical protein